MHIDRALLTTTLILQAGIIGWLAYDKWSGQEHKGSSLTALLEEPSLAPTLQPQQQAVIRALSAPPHQHLIMDPFSVSPMDMQRQMNRMFEDAVNTFGQLSGAMVMDQGWDSLPASPTMDMRVLGDRYEVIFSLPGCDPSNVTVNLEGRLLTVASSSSQASSSKSQFNRFQSRIQLPGPVGDAQGAKVQFTNGMMRITVPRGTGNGNATQRAKLI
ncbi:MAG: Hsp20/alpha crystallin family protein [Lentisphaerota bacterium]